jgi:hypothetical protein
MGAQVVSFLNWSHRAAPQPVADWSQQELAEFYRVESALIRAGLSIETDRGLSDEGDPWFVFLRAEDGEVVVHFARVDGEYLIAGPAYEKVARGYDFNALVRAMIARHPLVQPQERGGNILLHPAAILVAIVGTAFFKTGEAKAMDNDHRSAARKTSATSSGNPIASTPGASADSQRVHLDAAQAVAILAGAVYAMEQTWDYRDSSASPAAMAAAGADTIRTTLRESHVTLGDELTFDGLHAGVPRAVALAQAPAVLALTAVLSSIPGIDANPADHAAAGIEVNASPGAHLADHLDAGQRPVVMEIQLHADVSPNIQSIQLLREIAGGAGFEKLAIVPVDKIPEALADIIAGGANFYANPPTSADVPHIAPLEPVVAPPPQNEATPTTGDTPSTHNDAPPPHSDDTPPPVQVVTAPSAPAQSVTNDNYKIVAEQLINYFIAHTLTVDTIVSGKDVVIYDSRVTKHAADIADLDSVTFHFNDGSSISLVGEHSMLYHELT